MIPSDATEEDLIGQIEQLLKPQAPGGASFQPPEPKLAVKGKLIKYTGALLERFPQSAYRDRALIIRMESLADLARVHPNILQHLLDLTSELVRAGGDGEVTSEAAFYGIQAFVMAARLEGMPDERRMLGSLERYRAFLHDYPKSKRVPIIWAA